MTRTVALAVTLAVFPSLARAAAIRSPQEIRKAHEGPLWPELAGEHRSSAGAKTYPKSRRAGN